MYLFDKKTVYDLPFNSPDSDVPLLYGDVFLQNEREQSAYNFEHADTDMLFRHFADAEKECAPHDRAQAAAAGLRAVHQGQPHLQPARCARRDQRDRAAELHPARARRSPRRAARPGWRPRSRKSRRRRREMAELLLELLLRRDPRAHAGARGRRSEAPGGRRAEGGGPRLRRCARLRDAAAAGAGGRRPAGGAARCQRGAARPAGRRAGQGDPGLPQGRRPHARSTRRRSATPARASSGSPSSRRRAARPPMCCPA